ERVGRDDVGAGTKIGEMDGAYRAGLTEDKEIVVAAHLTVPGVETRAAVAFLVEAERLDHRAHGAVKHQDALAHQPLQDFVSGVGRHPTPLAPTLSPAARGSSPPALREGRRPSK